MSMKNIGIKKYLNIHISLTYFRAYKGLLVFPLLLFTFYDQCYE
jgi:hypothetical protein